MTETTNAVRQVLMNELGLSRESVREEVRSIVTTEIAKEMAKLVTQGFLEKIVAAKFEELVKKDRWDRDRIGGIVVEAAKKEAEQFVKDHLRLSAE